jgi:dihydrofolate synthase/folylpolyglutamate synthase
MRVPEAGSGMNLAAWLERLEALHPTAIELGLDRVRRVHQRLGGRRPGNRVVTVAGTNGKGSTVATLDAVLRAHGQRVGHTTSPHLLRFNERIVLDDRECADADIVAAFERIEAARTADPAVSLTYFEFAILAALDLLARGAPDVAILEVGLGGRLDAVNIIDADLAVITAVDLDHQSWLGKDRETIGAEKAGILRPGRPVVLGDREPPDSVTAAARSLDAPVQRIGRDYDLRPDAGGWTFRGRDLAGARVELERLPAPRLHPDAVATGLQAALALGLEPDRERVAKVLENQQLAGRMQRLRVDGVELLLDVAHNPHATRALAERLRAERRNRPRQVLFGTFADKDAPAMLEPLRDCGIEALYPVDTPGPRGRTAAELAAILPAGPWATHSTPSIESALESACSAARADGGQVLVFGSFTVVGAVLELLQRESA